MIIKDENLLRKKCSPVLSDEVSGLKSKLEEALEWSSNNGNPGVGLACPQIGIYKTMAIVRVENISLDLVNAKIIKKNYEFEFNGEGCLSFPGIYGKTKRYKEIVIGENLVWPNTFIATDFISVVCQHELDHLKGILLNDVMI